MENKQTNRGSVSVESLILGDPCMVFNTPLRPVSLIYNQVVSFNFYFLKIAIFVPLSSTSLNFVEAYFLLEITVQVNDG